MRAFALAAVFACVAAQSKEPSEFDANVVSLVDDCVSDGSAVAAGTTLTITQGSATAFTITATPTITSADGVWLTDAYGTVVAYAAGGVPPAGRTLTVSLENGVPLNLKAVVHTSGCATVADDSTTQTWQDVVDSYIASDAYVETAADWTPAQILAAQPSFTSVDYAAKTASVSVTQAAGRPVPFIYAKDSDNVVLGYVEPAAGPATHLLPFEIPAAATSVFGCAAVGGEMACTELSLVSDMAAEAAAANPGNSNQDPVATLLMTNTLTVTASDACASSGSYVLWLVDPATDDVLDAERDSSLSIASADTYSALTAYVACSGSTASLDIDVDVLVAANDAVDTTPDDPAPFEVEEFDTCDDEGVKYNAGDTWTRSDGAPCSCEQGLTVCGDPTTTWWDVECCNNTHAGVITASVGLIIMTALGIAAFCFMKHKASGPIAHVQKPEGGAGVRHEAV